MNANRQRDLILPFDAETAKLLEEACAAFAMQSAEAEKLPSKEYASSQEAFAAGLAYGSLRTFMLYSLFLIKDGTLNPETIAELTSWVRDNITKRQ